MARHKKTKENVSSKSIRDDTTAQDMAEQLLHHNLDKVVTRKVKTANVKLEASPLIIELHE